jgi:hypothetical protein
MVDRVGAIVPDPLRADHRGKSGSEKTQEAGPCQAG